MSEPFYWFWVARDVGGTLRIATEEPVLEGGRWVLPMADITVRNVGLRWIRNLPLDTVSDTQARGEAAG